MNLWKKCHARCLNRSAWSKALDVPIESPNSRPGEWEAGKLLSCFFLLLHAIAILSCSTSFFWWHLRHCLVRLLVSFCQGCANLQREFMLNPEVAVAIGGCQNVFVFEIFWPAKPTSSSPKPVSTRFGVTESFQHFCCNMQGFKVLNL